MIVGALLCKNEADRYLVRALTNAKSFCDQIVVVDDGSTDRTPDICREHGAVVFSREGQEGWFTGGERSARAFLWEEASKFAGENGWIYVFDADHELVGITPEDLRLLCRTRTLTCWSFPLYDCWDSDELMRVDGYWQAHLHPRPWLFRVLPGFVPVWPDKEIHTGHAPANFPIAAGLVPPGVGIRHMGYINPDDRKQKHQRYLALA